MSVKINIFYPALRGLIGDTKALRLEGSTVGECLDDLIRRYPGARELLFDPNGRLLKHVYVYVNYESLFKADLNRPVTDKDELILAVLAVGG